MRLALVPLLTAALFAPLLLVPGGAAHAAGLTCQGQPATIQTDGGVVTGTEGPDVIVATRAGTINALGGDDLICAAGGQLDAGAGDDTVVVGQTNGTNTQTAQLGPGTDRYTSTGQTIDSVVSGDGSAPNTDTIDTGPDGDRVTVTLPAGSSPTISAGSVGEGFDMLSVVAAPGDAAAWRAELTPASVISRDGAAVGTFSQFRYFSFDLGASSSLTVRGTAGPDRVQGLGAGSVDVDLGGGDDYLGMFDNVTVPSGGAIDLGPGIDRMSVGSRSSLDVDLREGRLGPVGLAGVETTIMAAPVVRYRGSTAADSALATCCVAPPRTRSPTTRRAGATAPTSADRAVATSSAATRTATASSVDPAATPRTAGRRRRVPCRGEGDVRALSPLSSRGADLVHLRYRTFLGLLHRPVRGCRIGA